MAPTFHLQVAARRWLVALSVTAACCAATGAHAQAAGAEFKNPAGVINAGVMPMGGSAFSANASVGQPHAGGVTAGASFSFNSGFMPIAALIATSTVAPVTSVILAAGGSHNCAIFSGALKCWGSNDQGQQGLGTTFPFQSFAQGVTGLGSGVAGVAAGFAHSCAITTGGAAKCWGANALGQLGTGAASAAQLTPVAVAGLGSGVVQLAGGTSHTCALTGAGGVKCWGQNNSGQVGDGTFTDRASPTDVFGLTSGVAAIAAGGAHSCALTTGGSMVCWGLNSSGELGDSAASGASSNKPVGVSGLGSGAAAIGASLVSTCAVTTGGAAKCWGANSWGGLGDGSTTTRFAPVNVTGLSSGVAAIAPGNLHTCALMNNGAVKCWGKADAGQLGTGTAISSTTPVDVPMIGAGNVAIASSQTDGPGGHTCVIAGTGGAFCWGSGYGASPLRVVSTPVDFPLAPVITSVTPGDTQVIVAFTPPEYTGASPITSYSVNCGGHIATGTTSPITVTGLTNGTPVTCTVTPSNTQGAGSPSITSASVTPTAGAPVFSASPTSLTFGARTVNTTSAARTVTISNTGTQPLTVSAAAVSGPFAISANTCTTVAVSATCTIQVRFAPVIDGATSGTLGVTTNAAGSPHSIALGGSAVARNAGSFIYVANETSNFPTLVPGTVSVVDTVSNEVVTEIPVGLRPNSVVINSAGTTAYVANSAGSSVSVISTASNTVTAEIPVYATSAVAVSPAGTRVYVATSAGPLVVLDAATNAVIASIDLVAPANGIAVHPSGKRVYVLQTGVATVAVVDAVTNTKVKTLKTAVNATGIAVNPNGTEVWVVNNASNSVSVIKTDTDTLHPSTGPQGTFGGFASPWGVNFNPAGTLGYIAQYGSDKLTVVDTTSYSFVANVDMQYNPSGVDISADGTRAYVTNLFNPDPTTIVDYASGNLTVVDTAANAVLKRIPLGNNPKSAGRMTAWGTSGLIAPAVTSGAPLPGAVGTIYSHTFTASGTAPYDWSISAGTLPAGLTLDAATGVLSGTPTTTGPYTFTVQVTNGVGAGATQSVSLLIGNAGSITVPDAPVIGTATAGNTNASVTFAPPANNGGYPITGYTATCGNKSASGAASPIVVTDLTGGVAVTCTVVASNALGSSVPSAASNSVTPVIPVLLNLPLFNTGVAADGSLLAGGAVDPHYTLTVSPEPSLPGPNAIVTTNIAEGYWLPQGPNSKWIAPSANQSFPAASPCNASGSYTYRTTFDLSGYDLATASIQVQWAADNSGTGIRLNGGALVGSNPGYGALAPVTFNSGFVAGVNTLDFTLLDIGCPNGLRVELSGQAALVVPNGVVAPTITSSATANGATGTAFSYQISATSTPASFSAGGTLPTGVTLNAGTGLISGTPTQAGTFNVTVSATNAGGTGSLPIVITITSGVVQFTVTPSGGMGGSISPSTAQLVTSGATTAFTVTPDAGYSTSMGGTCGGALVGSTYTTNTITANCTVTAAFSLLPVLQGVVSRKFHGTSGDFFDVIVDHNIAIDGLVDTEPRMVGSGFTLIFSFDRAITTAGPVTAVDRFGDPVGVASATASGNNVVVTLIGVPNNQRVQVSLTGVNGSGVATASMGFLVGDVGNNRSVSSRDISAIKARRNRALNVNNNFRADANLSGIIDAADVTMAKTRAGLKLP